MHTTPIELHDSGRQSLAPDHFAHSQPTPTQKSEEISP